MTMRLVYLSIGAAALLAGTMASLGATAQEPPIDSLQQALDVGQTWEYGEPGAALEFIRAEVLRVQMDPGPRNDLANTLAGMLQDAASTDAFKTFVCQQLYLIGGEGQVDALVPLLNDPRYAHVARYALEVIPSPAVSDALWQAIDNADGSVAAGIAASLAARGGPKAASRLTVLLSHPDADVVTAAIIGLGRQGGPEAETPLRNAVVSLPDTHRTAIYEALLGCAWIYQQNGNAIDAERLFTELFAADMPLAVRQAAFHGLVELGGEKAAPLIAEALASGEQDWAVTAMAHVRHVGGPVSTALFARQLAVVSPEVQVLLLQALADRRDPAALEVVLGGLNSAAPEVRLATIDTLGTLGNETTVPWLISAALDADEETATRGRESLVRMADTGVNGALIAYYETSAAEAQVVLSGILADRQAVAALPVLLDSAAYEAGEARDSALAALGALARHDAVPQLVPLLYEAEDEAHRTKVARMLTAVFRRIPPSEERAAMLEAIYTDAPSTVVRSSTLALYRDLGDDRLLPTVVAATHSDDSVIRDGGVAALTSWPTATPLDDVYALAEQATITPYREKAIDGYIRMLRMRSEAPVEDQVARFKQALSLKGGPEATRNILAGLSAVPSVEALELAEGLMADETVRAEAAVAAEKIRRNFYSARASVSGDTAGQALDDNIGTAWKTPEGQAPGQWIEIDMSRAALIKGVILDSSRTPDGYPRGYQVYLYEHGGLPGEAIAVGAGTPGVTTIPFARPMSGRMLRIEQTRPADGTPWVIHEIRVLPE